MSDGASELMDGEVGEGEGGLKREAMLSPKLTEDGCCSMCDSVADDGRVGGRKLVAMGSMQPLLIHWLGSFGRHSSVVLLATT